jgi:hypothetical protein
LKSDSLRKNLKHRGRHAGGKLKAIMGGELREYVRAYWAAVRAAYSQAKAVWNFVLAVIPALALFGFSWASPSLLPAWAAPAWFVSYLVLSVLIYVPYRMWKQQRAKIAELTLPDGPIPDMPIRELFDHVGRNGEGTQEIGMAILDKLSTGQLAGWGRTQERRLFAPLVQIEQSYWGIAGWSYYFLPGMRDSLSDEVHVWPRLTSLDGQRFYDVHMNRVQALRIWPR